MNTTFETGASCAQANDLVLTCMNDGSMYADRMHCASAALQGAHHRVAFRELANQTAQNMRRSFGSKFRPQHITEAANILQAQTAAHCLESIRDAWNGQHITATCRRWFDTQAGNSYYSVWVSVPTDAGVNQFAMPMQYGYGDQWQRDTITTLESIGLDLGNHDYPREYPITFQDCGYGLKRNMFEGIHNFSY